MSFVVKILIFISFATSMSHASETIVVESDAPGCFQLSNTAIQTAISDANKNATYECQNPVLISLDAQIQLSGDCTPVKVIAEYSCPKKAHPWCKRRPQDPCCASGEYICF